MLHWSIPIPSILYESERKFKRGMGARSHAADKLKVTRGPSKQIEY